MQILTDGMVVFLGVNGACSAGFPWLCGLHGFLPPHGGRLGWQTFAASRFAALFVKFLHPDPLFPVFAS
jgi:hypothetical protein